MESFGVFSADLTPFSSVVLLHEVHDTLGVVLDFRRTLHALLLQYLRNEFYANCI